MQLYNHFKSKFEQKIIDFGGEKMKRKVGILHKYNKNGNLLQANSNTIKDKGLLGGLVTLVICISQLILILK